MRATCDTAAGRAYLDLQAKAKADGQPTDALLVLYALEGFLARLAASGHSDKLVPSTARLASSAASDSCRRHASSCGNQSR